MIICLGANMYLDQKNQDGFTIVLIPIIFTVVGLFLANILQKSETSDFYGPVRTLSSMQDIRHSLASFAHRNHRLPCPANPAVSPTDPLFGTEDFDAANNRCAVSASGMAEGILPFRELGLTDREIRDAWGNYLTYSLNVSLSEIPLTGTIDNAFYHYEGGDTPPQPLPVSFSPTDVNSGVDVASTFVHERCRQPGSWIRVAAENHGGRDGNSYAFLASGPDGESSARNINSNIYKAQFCCARGYQDNLGVISLDMATTNAPNSLVESLKDYIQDGQIVGNIQSFEWFGEQPGSTNPEKIATITGVSEEGDVELTWKDFGDGGGIGLIPVDGLNPEELADFDEFGVGESLIIDFVEAHPVVSLELSGIEADERGQGVDVLVSLIDEEGLDLSQVSKIVPLPVAAPGGSGFITLNASSFAAALESEQNGENDESFNVAKIKTAEIKGGNASWLLSAVQLVRDSSGTGSGDAVAQGGPSILDSNGQRILKEQSRNAYRPADEIPVSSTIADDVESLAYVMISHGSNGVGAFIGDGTSNRRGQDDGFSGVGSKELQNINDPDVFTVAHSVQSAGINYNDDIVLWDSQFSLYNALPNASCDEPGSAIAPTPPSPPPVTVAALDGCAVGGEVVSNSNFNDGNTSSYGGAGASGDGAQAGSQAGPNSASGSASTNGPGSTTACAGVSSGNTTAMADAGTTTVTGGDGSVTSTVSASAHSGTTTNPDGSTTTTSSAQASSQTSASCTGGCSISSSGGVSVSISGGN